MKPASWPRYMREKPLKSGGAGYFWQPPQGYIGQGFTGHAEALGRDYALAVSRATLLNAHLDAWRTGRGATPVEEARGGFGTVTWLFDRYLKSSAYTARVSKRSDYEYRRALARIENTPTTTGGTVGALPVPSITPAAVDKIYSKLQIGPRGKRVRQANLSIDIARRAWDVMRRLVPAVVPAENPWRGVERDNRRAVKPAATRAEAYALAAALKVMGEPHLGAAALICFEWHQRPEHVLAGDITWQDYRPDERPDAVFVRHHKTGAKGWKPLHDNDDAGTPLHPELDAYLQDLPRLAVPIVVTSGARGPSRPYAFGFAQRLVRKARTSAKLGSHVTLDSCRHGGLTEHGDSGATEAETMAASMHRTPQAARLYVKRTEDQQRAAGRKRRQLVAARTKTV